MDQHELKPGARRQRLEGGGCRLGALAEVGRGEAALTEVREDCAAYDAVAKSASSYDCHGDRLPNVSSDPAERGRASTLSWSVRMGGLSGQAG